MLFPQPSNGFHWRAFFFPQVPACTALAWILRLPIIPCGERRIGCFSRFSRRFFRRFSPFKKNADFSPNSTFSASKRRFYPLFSWIALNGCQEKSDENLLHRRTADDFEVPPEKISNLLQIGGGGGGDEENSPPDAPIPHRAIANRRRECRLRNDNK